MQFTRAIVLAGCLVLSYTSISYVRSGYQAEMVPPTAPLTAIPLQLGDYSGKDIAVPDDTVLVMGANSFINRTYVSPSGPAIVLHGAAFTDPVYIGTTPHHPTVCYPAAGWKVIEQQLDEIQAGGEKIPIRLILFQRRSDLIVTAHWFRTGEDIYTESEGLRTQMAAWGKSTRPCIEKFLIQVDASSIERAKSRIAQFASLVETAWQEALSESQTEIAENRETTS